MNNRTDRPTSPHATLYRLPIGMATSIFHRLTAVGMVMVGTLMMTAWLFSIAQGPETYAQFLDFTRSWIGTIILFALTWCVCQHFASGLRHLFMDTGRGVHVQASKKSAMATYLFSFSATLAIWLAISLR